MSGSRGGLPRSVKMPTIASSFQVQEYGLQFVPGPERQMRLGMYVRI